MTRPKREEPESVFETLARRAPSPEKVQALLRKLPYNREKPSPTLRSALVAWRKKTAHCLEAAFLAAAILERRGFPPLVMSLESVDSLDHVVFVFERKGRWGSIGRSRDDGLHGREPIFKSPRELAASYIDPYVDHTGRITGFGVANLDDSRTPWRDSPRNVWKAEQYLIDFKHQPVGCSDRRYRELLAHYQAHGSHPPKSWWW
jgi:hypothetical protein